MMITACTPTDTDRADYRALMDAARVYEYGTPANYRLQFAAADKIVSCYIGANSGEDIHETRRDGSCRCGYHGTRPARPSN